MVDFKKKHNSGDSDKKINPLEIYNDLDRRSVTGPLRPAQTKILEEWYNTRLNDKDLIIKLHTGEGKTLIGLLILLSVLNRNEGPCVFACPNIYLVEQVCLEAKKFGIPFCKIPKDNSLPNEFLEGKKILITYIQKIFNGKSIFGLDNNFIKIGSIILDDSHACIDSIKNSFTIKIPKDHDLYSAFKTLFEDDLRGQGEGSFLDIDSGSYNTLLPVPYWSWIDKKANVLELLSKYKEDKKVTFTWPIIKNSIENCQAFFTGNEIEILSHNMPVKYFGSFGKAKQRILMSATTQDDSFFIKGLGFSVASVQNPLTFTDQKWSGEKMLLIPSLIDDSLDRDLIVTKLIPPSKKTFGIVSLVSSFKRSEQYFHLGALVSDPENIFEHINLLKSGHFEKNVVIINRYDGIDLPDEACRVLIIDSMPFFNSLLDRYEEQCRLDSDIIKIKFAQKIEQGLGRSVRGEKDYSVILLIGADLVKFIKSVTTNKYFSPQTKKQIEIGLEIAELAKGDLAEGEPSFNVVSGLIKQSILRDDGWKGFYKDEMDKIKLSENKSNIYNILQLENDAEEASNRSDYELACSIIQKLIDTHIKEETEKGWYLQVLARYKYFISVTESNKIQKSAFYSNLQLLKPRDGISYKKIEYINENRIKRLKEWISKYNNYDELMLSVDSILSDFTFGIEAEKFESSLKEIGALLGFVSQRPDKEIKKGPDNLWGGIDNKYFLFECKSEVDESREDINKNEAGQMNSHCGWFESEYSTAYVKRILIIPTKSLSYYGNFTHDVKIMRKGKLKSLKTNIKAFIKEFKPYNIKEISEEKIQEFFNTHHLDINSLETEYSEDYTKKK